MLAQAAPRRNGPSAEESQGGAAAEFGLQVETLRPQMARQIGLEEDAVGVIVTRVTANSSAAEAGLRPGMVIVRVGDQPVESAEAFHRAMEGRDAAAGVRLRVRTPQGYAFLILKEKPERH
jgi:serine protease Do